MDNQIKSVAEVFAIYLEYLSHWNKSHSLESVLKYIKERPHMYEDDKSELISICHSEWVDTQSLTSEYVMKVDDFLRALLVKIRDEKIDKIIINEV